MTNTPSKQIFPTSSPSCSPPASGSAKPSPSSGARSTSKPAPPKSPAPSPAPKARDSYARPPNPEPANASSGPQLGRRHAPWPPRHWPPTHRPRPRPDWRLARPLQHTPLPPHRPIPSRQHGTPRARPNAPRPSGARPTSAANNPHRPWAGPKPDSNSSKPAA
jgi:hypothetical protein